MTVMIRDLQRSDQDQVRKMVLEGLAERWGQEFDPAYNKDLDDIYGYYIARHHATVAVITEDQQQASNPVIIGCGILLPLPAEDVYGTWCAEPESIREKANSAGLTKLCRMMRLSVSADRRGQGLAKMMIRHLIEKARERGFELILVETEVLWTSAVQIYKSEGFSVAEADDENVHYTYRL
ncbi:acyl-CoA N-acyltransferase [Linnemannia elongata AG-77]|uniref:Probable N-acetyltransferase 14 n=1 Tax=Linnemannia elongata AG-77 TaxID=1314771 RepID=A0A197JPH7_9FUNG|nr:acyl-CoA N-acyltransferase [Linnemannia elongata AG-77]